MVESETIVVFPSAARTASGSSSNQLARFCKGLVAIIDMTAVPGVDTVTFTIEGFDPISGKYFPILTSAAIVAVSTVVLRVYPGLTVAANLTANDVMPAGWRIRTTHSAGSSFTYSVAAMLVP